MFLKCLKSYELYGVVTISSIAYGYVWNVVTPVQQTLDVAMSKTCFKKQNKLNLHPNNL